MRVESRSPLHMGQQLSREGQLQVVPGTAALHDIAPRVWCISSIHHLVASSIEALHQVSALVRLQAQSRLRPDKLDHLLRHAMAQLLHLCRHLPRRRRLACLRCRSPRASYVASTLRPPSVPHLPHLGRHDYQREREMVGLARRHGRWCCLPWPTTRRYDARE